MPCPLDAHNGPAESALGVVYQKLGRMQEAEAAFKQSAALRPGDWSSLDELANFYDQRGRFKEAIHELQLAQKLTPDNTQVLINLAAAYEDAGDPSQLPVAEDLLKRAISISPSYAAYANLANIYSSEGRHQEAADVSERALAINDQDPIVWVNLLTQYEWLKQMEKAKFVREKSIALLERAAHTSPREATPQALLAQLYGGRHDREKALTHIETTLALTPDDPQNLASVADAYENLGDREKALTYIRKALEKGLPLDQVKSDIDLQKLLPYLHPERTGK